MKNVFLKCMKYLVLIGCTYIFVGSPVVAEEDHIEITPEADTAILKALKFLSQKQASDGSFSDGDYGKNVGIHALVMMAFMSMGHLPGEGEYGHVTAKALDWLISNAKDSGLIENKGKKGSSNAMYSHALATLALSEVWGQTRRKDVGEVLVKAVNLILRCQGPKGSWGYYSTPMDGDTSITVMQVFALKSANEAGIFVPKETMDKALAVIKSRFDKKNKMYGYGGPENFIGSKHSGSHAAGTCIMMICGETDPEYTIEAWKNCVLSLKKINRYNAYFSYYGSVCSYYAGPKYFEEWNKINEAFIIKRQSAKGEVSNVLSTAWAVLSLSLPYRYIPVYQHEEK